jgi:hypothetical protein
VYQSAPVRKAKLTGGLCFLFPFDFIGWIYIHEEGPVGGWGC